MLEFPFYSFGLFLLLFPIIGIAAIVTGIYQIINGEKEESLLRNILPIFVGIIFLFVGFVASIGNVWSTYNFRSIDISQVKGFRAIKSVDEYNRDNSQFIYYEKPQSVQEALRGLKNCSSSSRNHESYQDGFKLQIIFTDESLGQDFYISVYRKSNSRPGKAVVIPHYYMNKNLNLGEFSCPEFQDWVQKNIDPLFQNK